MLRQIGAIRKATHIAGDIWNSCGEIRLTAAYKPTRFYEVAKPDAWVGQKTLKKER
jgi:hypothetical protein